MIAGTIAVGAVGAIAVGIAQAALNQVNTENTNLAARLTAIENSRYSLPSSVSTDIAANCAAMTAIGALTPPADAAAATIDASADAIIAAAKANPC